MSFRRASVTTKRSDFLLFALLCGVGLFVGALVGGWHAVRVAPSAVCGGREAPSVEGGRAGPRASYRAALPLRTCRAVGHQTNCLPHVLPVSRGPVNVFAHRQAGKAGIKDLPACRPMGKNTSARLGSTSPEDPYHQQLAAVKLAPHGTHIPQISRRRTPSNPHLFSLAPCLITRPHRRRGSLARALTRLKFLLTREIDFSAWRDGPAANRPPPLT